MKLHELQKEYFEKFVHENGLKTGGVPITSERFLALLSEDYGHDVYWTIGNVRRLMTKAFMKRQNQKTGKTEYFINKEI